jgi:hypothetical protein
MRRSQQVWGRWQVEQRRQLCTNITGTRGTRMAAGARGQWGWCSLGVRHSWGAAGAHLLLVLALGEGVTLLARRPAVVPRDPGLR